MCFCVFHSKREPRDNYGKYDVPRSCSFWKQKESKQKEKNIGDKSLIYEQKKSYFFLPCFTKMFSFTNLIPFPL